ncbi:MAG: 23S rRNA (uracil(1939)-C(5))-methyltransferase RlmD [Endomicrobiales bacterium]
MKLTVNKIVYPGRSLAVGDDGIVVFSDGALPGECIDVTITKNKKSYKEASLLSIDQPSSDRIVPRCPSFGVCGGCTFQHTTYANQLKIKDAYVRELLSPWVSSIEPLIASPEEWHYRNKMEFSFFDGSGHLSPDTPVKSAVSLGLHQRNEFNRYFPVPPCFICDGDFLPVIEDVVRFARTSGLGVYDKRKHSGFFRHLVVRKSKRGNQVLINLVTNMGHDINAGFFEPLLTVLPANVASVYWTQNGGISDAVNVDLLTLLRGNTFIEEKLEVRGRTYSFVVSPFSFFQTNTLGTEKLYETVLAFLEPASTDRVLDLYCGTGTIGIVLAPYVNRVMGVEQVESAVENARENARRNGIENISFATGSVERWIKKESIPDCNALVVDPPRGGLSNKVIDFIEKCNPEKIVYVSCNPATLARDLTLITARGYGVNRVVPVDMFPQTYHVEIVVSLRKK